MENVKETIAKNLVYLRKKNKLTQQQLAEKLNYSDKAISRWEHAETLPDIETLCRVCEIYGVKFEYLLQKEQPEDSKNPYVKKPGDTVQKILITLIAVAVIWLIATVVFMYQGMIFGNYGAWTLFIWGIPASCAVMGVCNRLWGNRLLGVINISLFFWSLILAIYLEMLKYNLWMLFIIGVPIQTIIILSATLKAQKSRYES